MARIFSTNGSCNCSGVIDKVILATSPALEGEATADWLTTALRGFPVKITRIAPGVHAGSDIEYADDVTMAPAIEGRREIEQGVAYKGNLTSLTPLHAFSCTKPGD